VLGEARGAGPRAGKGAPAPHGASFIVGLTYCSQPRRDPDVRGQRWRKRALAELLRIVPAQPRQKSLKRVGASSVYRTVC
jgi:hypothetical protein